MTAKQPFRIDMSLRPGVTVVQASAGTGKTWSIASLVARLVAEEGLGIDRILVMTFTKAATAELRERIRWRLGEAAAVLAGRLEPGDDAALVHMAACAQADRPQQQARLEAALRDYDTASISTIHGFCQRVLQLHAFETQVDFATELLDQTDAVIEEIVDDFLTASLYAVEPAACAWLTQTCKLTRKALLEVARFVVGRGEVELPAVAGDAPTAWARYQEALAGFRPVWRAGRDGLVAALDAEIAGKRLNGNSYRVGSPQRWADEVDAWLAAGAVPTADLTDESWCKGFLPTHLASKRNASATNAFSHPVTAAWGAVVERLPQPDDVDAPRLAFARHVRMELPARLQKRGLLSFADLLRVVHERIQDPALGEPLCQALRQRFAAILIDEFQDTDPLQWGIFERVFAPQAHAPPVHHLYLIGDPKQAIYSFRGADVFVSGAACNRPDAQGFTITCNQRSDARYVAAMNALFSGEPDAFASEDIAYEQVTAAARHRQDRLQFPIDRAPLQIRWFDGRDLPDAPPTDKTWRKKDVAPRLPHWVAGEIRSLLDARPLLTSKSGPPAPLQARDVTVLVRSNRQARPIQRALRYAGLPAIVSQTGNVWRTDAALAVLRWLEAVARPDQEGPTRLLAVTPLIGWTATALHEALTEDTAANRAWTSLREDVHAWAECWRSSGFLSAIHTALQDPGRAVFERLAARDDGERWLTDLRHVLELLHAAAIRDHLDAAGLLRLGRDRRTADDDAADGVQQRLESDADAVQITTLHRSKGLQYPVVVLPYAWDGRIQLKDTHFAWHEGREPRLELSLCKTAERDRRAALAKVEQAQEDMRLLYVGLTRAQHHAIALWGPATDYTKSALSTLLCGAHPDGGGGLARAEHARQRLEAPPAIVQTRLEAAVADMHATLPRLDVTLPLVAVREALAEAMPLATPAVRRPDVVAAVYTRAPFDQTWKRLSYTLLTRGHEVHLADERQKTDDDLEADVHAEPDAPRLPDDVPMFAFPRGPGPGTYVHKIMELLDFQTLHARTGGLDLPALVASQGVRHGVPEPLHHRLLVEGVRRVVVTPLGHGLGRLAELPVRDRLDEWAFDLSIGGTTGVDGSKLAAALALDPDPNVFPGDYLSQLAALPFGRLAGYLTGSIDLAFRIRPAGHEVWFIADYKTNVLGERLGGRLVASRPQHYDTDGLRREMAHHHYFLQYHLYLTALHRYLQLRLGPRYDYDRHVGGAVYLFVRGMLGADAVPGRGVFRHKPRREVIEALSQVFGGQP